MASNLQRKSSSSGSNNPRKKRQAKQGAAPHAQISPQTGLSGSLGSLGDPSASGASGSSHRRSRRGVYNSERSGSGRSNGLQNASFESSGSFQAKQSKSAGRSGRDRSSASRSNAQLQSRTIKEVRKSRKRKERIDAAGRAAKASRVPFIIIGIIVLIVAIAVASVFFLSKTDAFRINNVNIEGVDHLTSQEVGALVSIPDGTTLLNVDADSIERNLMRDSWVESVEIKREFPETLVIVVHERQIGAIAEVPMGQTQTIQNWALSNDHIWLMAIPSKDSELGNSIAPRIYEDAENALHISNIPFGVNPTMGAECTDPDILNALSIISGLTTELADQVRVVQAADVESTALILDNNIEIAFGSADNIREKERICLEIMQNNPTVVYINVRIVDRPTWRSL